MEKTKDILEVKAEIGWELEVNGRRRHRKGTKGEGVCLGVGGSKVKEEKYDKEEGKKTE